MTCRSTRRISAVSSSSRESWARASSRLSKIMNKTTSWASDLFRTILISKAISHNSLLTNPNLPREPTTIDMPWPLVAVPKAPAASSSPLTTRLTIPRAIWEEATVEWEATAVPYSNRTNLLSLSNQIIKDLKYLALVVSPPPSAAATPSTLTALSSCPLALNPKNHTAQATTTTRSPPFTTITHKSKQYYKRCRSSVILSCSTSLSCIRTSLSKTSWCCRRLSFRWLRQYIREQLKATAGIWARTSSSNRLL